MFPYLCFRQLKLWVLLPLYGGIIAEWENFENIIDTGETAPFFIMFSMATIISSKPGIG